MLFTLDKLIYKLVKQFQAILADELGQVSYLFFPLHHGNKLSWLFSERRRGSVCMLVFLLRFLHSQKHAEVLGACPQQFMPADGGQLPWVLC